MNLQMMLKMFGVTTEQANEALDTMQRIPGIVEDLQKRFIEMENNVLLTKRLVEQIARNTNLNYLGAVEEEYVRQLALVPPTNYTLIFDNGETIDVESRDRSESGGDAYRRDYANGK